MDHDKTSVTIFFHVITTTIQLIDVRTFVVIGVSGLSSSSCVLMVGIGVDVLDDDEDSPPPLPPILLLMCL